MASNSKIQQSDQITQKAKTYLKDQVNVPAVASTDTCGQYL